MKPEKAVLLVGSPRGEKSASRALGKRLLSGIAERGAAVEIHSIYGAWASEAKMAALLDAVDAAGLVVFAFPLYVDHLPALVVRLCERIAARRRWRTPAARPRLAAVVQCGFPETSQNQPAIDIMRRFAELAGFEWAGGLAMGMGGAVEGRLADKPSGMLRHVIKGLDLAAAALAEGNPIPAQAVEAFGKSLMPTRFYFAVANLNWKRTARKSGRGIDLYARPYAE
jgi:hypothetical protein